VHNALRWWPPGTVHEAMFNNNSWCHAVFPKEFRADLRITITRGLMHYTFGPTALAYANRPAEFLETLRAAMALPAPAAPPDVDFMVYVDDGPAGLNFDDCGSYPPPLFAMAEAEDLLTPAVPDFSFSYYNQNTGGNGEEKLHYTELQQRILESSAARPYATRVRKLLWRGQLDEAHRIAFNGTMRARGDLYDAGLGVAPDEASKALPLADHSAFAVQLYLAGTGYSIRLKYLLATGSPVLVYVAKENGRWHEFYWRALIPWVHYVPLHHPDNLELLVRWLLDHPAEAARIGAAGQAYAREFLSHSSATCYWRTFFSEYTALLQGPAVLPAGANRILTDVSFPEFEQQVRQGHHAAMQAAQREKDAAAAAAAAKAPIL